MPDKRKASDEHQPVLRKSAWVFIMGISIKKKIRYAALRAFPRLALKLFSIRSRRLIEHQASTLGLNSLARAISKITRGKVVAGPFAGMRLDYELFPVHASPKFLGTYEQELHDVIESAIQLDPRYVLNIGCAEGFYAVGLAIRLVNAQIFAADADPKALRATLKNAELNGVSGRVSAVGIVQPGQFHRYLKPDVSLLLMDCEGAEFHLLDPRNDAVLLRTNILVEIHTAIGDKCDIIRRFALTHNVCDVSPSVRTVSDIRVGSIAGIDLLSAADERRGDHTSWLFLKSKSQLSPY